MKCEAIGNPLPILSWINNHQTLFTSKTFNDSEIHVKTKYQTDAQFVIKYPSSNAIEIELQMENCVAGVHRYDCIAFNELREDNQSVFVESISGPTFSIENNETIESAEGSSTTIICDVIGYPIPEIVWLKVCKSLLSYFNCV